MGDVSCHFSTVKGFVGFDYQVNGEEMEIQLSVPKETAAIVRIPKSSSSYNLVGKGKYEELNEREDQQYRYFKLPPGNWEIAY